MQGGHMERMAFHKGHKDGAPFGRMLQGLDLNETQQAEVKRILDERRGAAQQQHPALRANQTALHELATGAAYDPQQVRALADTQARLQADMIVARTEAMHRVHQVLTPEQQAEWRTLHEQRQQKRQERQREPAQ
jgi:Spy/CpxP family protein refolding chaperone